MSAVTRPRGPLSPRVYWTRRLLVLAVAFALVVGLARLLGSGSDGDGEPEATAEQVGAEPTASASEGTPSATPETSAPAERRTEAAKKQRRKPRKPEPLADPDGPCDPADLAVTPTLDRAVADDEIRIRFDVEGAAEACTWQASGTSLVVRITSGDDLIWTSQHCPQAIPEKDVVVRAAKPARVAMTWNGKRSDEDCSRLTDWAVPGWYHVDAAALGGEPSDKQFELERMPRATVTRTAEPDPGKQERRESRPTEERPDGERDGAREPNG